ncbi:MAG TPA: hypothetical protein VF006_28125 [Longimicrobium sp.]
MAQSSTLRKTLFAAGVLGCMGFGSAQAFATPQPTTDVSICNDNVCMAGCLARGYWGGYCSYRGCECYRIDE